MEALFFSAFRAVRSIFAPGMLSVFIQSLFFAIFILISFIIGVVYASGWLAALLHSNAFAWLLPWLGSMGASLLAWMLFPGIMPIIISFFDDKIARLIEAKDYPASPTPRPYDFWKELRHDIGFSLWAVTLNILVLPLYLVPGLNLILFYLLNGYLLGREFFNMAARRHVPREEAQRLYKQHHMAIIAAGIILTILATSPVLNLFAPFWGIAVMVHMYHHLQPKPPVELLLPN